MAAVPAPVLVYALENAPELTRRLRPLGFEPLVESGARAAATRITRGIAPVRAALIPADFALPDRRGELEELTRAAGPGGIRFVAVGEAPREPAARALRESGVRLRLASPFHDSELRFVLNRALFGSGRGARSGWAAETRHEPRVPTSLGARVVAAGREKPALVYSLSAAGCYLDTQRPLPVGARLDLVLELPAQALRLAGRVVLTNVAGNLERVNLPRGMAVEWVAPGPEALEALRGYVRERTAAFEL